MIERKEREKMLREEIAKKWERKQGTCDERMYCEKNKAQKLFEMD